MPLDIVYHEVELKQVLAYWAKDYKEGTGKIFNVETFVDPQRGMVIFKIFKETPEDNRPG